MSDSLENSDPFRAITVEALLESELIDIDNVIYDENTVFAEVLSIIEQN